MFIRLQDVYVRYCLHQEEDHMVLHALKKYAVLNAYKNVYDDRTNHLEPFFMYINPKVNFFFMKKDFQ